MSLAEQWLAEYAETHGDGDAVPHWFFVPVATLSFVGLLWYAPVPREFAESTPALNWGALMIMATIVYYFILSMPLALGLLPFVVLTVVLLSAIERVGLASWPLCAAAFGSVWLGRCLLRRLRGRPPRIAAELQLLMIGPLWLLAKVYRRLGIPY